MSTVRLAMNEQTEEVMALLEERYKPLSRAEILKLALARLNQDMSGDTLEILDYKGSRRLDSARQEIMSGKGKKAHSVSELIEELEN